MLIIFFQVAKSNLEKTLRSLDNEIQLNRRLCEDKQAYHAIGKVQTSLDKLDELLLLLLNENDCNIIILNRAVADYNHLTYNMSKCSNILKEIHKKVYILIYLINFYQTWANQIIKNFAKHFIHLNL